LERPERDAQKCVARLACRIAHSAVPSGQSSFGIRWPTFAPASDPMATGSILTSALF